MEQQPVELVGTGAGAIEQVLEDRRHLAHREFVDLLAIHLDRFKAAALGLAAGHHGGVLLALGQGEAAVAAAIGAHAEAQQAVVGPGAGLHRHGGGAIAEQHAGAAIVPVDPAAELVGADHQGAAHAAAADVLAGGDQGKQEAAAGGRDVEGHGVAGPQHPLDPRGRTEEVVGAGGGQNDQVQVARLPAGMGQGLAAGLAGQAGDRFARAGNVPGADAGAAADPVVVGLDPLTQLGVAEAHGW